ncbi:alpha/beta fold hydrolase [Inquilinus limosus]|uniref:alpha/beta hydrolase family protein n=1 Tax=Inquilinus limosus TaxID=171674 RepID=UPI003F15CA24
MQRILFKNNPSFWYETLRCFGHIAYGGADFGEVLVTADRIVEGDYDSWHDEWKSMADRVAAVAERSLAGGHRVSARDGFLRACNYYRSAGFFLHANPTDPRIHTSFNRGVDCFRAAAKLFEPTIEPVEIPYEKTTLPGYFYRGAGAGSERRPVVVMHSGFDGSAEEMHFSAAAGIAEHGYHVLTFDGPGQAGPIHREGLVFRSDWENVVGPVLDHLLTRPEIDPDRVALLGVSMGGILAPRAAAFEPRVKAVIALNGIYDMGTQAISLFGEGDRNRARQVLRAESAPKIDAMLAEMEAKDPHIKWSFSHGKWVLGESTSRGYVAGLLEYHLADGIAERIACPTLVCSGSSDQFFKGQPEMLYEHLTCPKTFLEFTGELGDDEHCQAGAQRLAIARISDWLDDTFGRTPGKI